MAIADGPRALSAAVMSQFARLSSGDHDAIVLFHLPAPENATAAAIAEWISAGVVAFFIRTEWWRGQPERRSGAQPRAMWSADMVVRVSESGRCHLGEADQ